VRAYLNKLPGVKSASVSFDKKSAQITWDAQKTDADKLSAGLSQASSGRYSMQVQR
jgi:copper chaperone CopZ